MKNEDPREALFYRNQLELKSRNQNGVCIGFIRTKVINKCFLQIQMSLINVVKNGIYRSTI